jgi:hypothetical protein
MTARWPVHVGAVLLGCAAGYLVPRRWALEMVLGPVLAGVCCLVAFSADRGAPAAGLVRSARAGLGRLAQLALALHLIVSLCAWAVFCAAVPPGQTLPLLPGLGGEALPRSDDFSPAAGALLALALWAGAALPLMLVPLLVCTDAPIALATELAFEAVMLNPFLMALGLGLGAVCIAGVLWHGVAAVALLPLVGSLMYVAWRHVFLNQAPRPKAARAPALARAAWSAR